jgi:hypothetical protein
MTKYGPVALAAAAAVLAIAVGLYLFGGRNVGDMTPTPTPSPTASAAATCTQTTMTPSAGRLDIAWCSNRTDAPSVPIAFSMDAQPTWDDQFYRDPEPALWLFPTGGGGILVAVDPDRTVDELMADINGREGYEISNEADLDLDGASGVMFDLTLADGASAGSTEPLVETSQQSWVLSDGSHRVWIVDHDGETVLFVAGEELVDAVTESLSTLTWGD